VETLLMQMLAGVFVVGSYYGAEHLAKKKRRDKMASRAAIENAAATARANPGTPRIDRGPSPAAVRGAAYAADANAMPTTICDNPATTMCGAPATEARAATELAQFTNRSVGAEVPTAPVQIAPAFQVRPLTLDLPPLQIKREPVAFKPRASFASSFLTDEDNTENS
jgi:hypothetical protein